jgi:hypothetical protein
VKNLNKKIMCALVLVVVLVSSIAIFLYLSSLTTNFVNYQNGINPKNHQTPTESITILAVYGTYSKGISTISITFKMNNFGYGTFPIRFTAFFSNVSASTIAPQDGYYGFDYSGYSQTTNLEFGDSHALIQFSSGLPKIYRVTASGSTNGYFYGTWQNPTP